jgi:hypothetical protein
MIAKLVRYAFVVFAVAALVCVAADANAACCGGGGYATTAFYPQTATSFYAPATYQTAYSGWYPGYYWDRVRTRLWASPTTYVAAVPSTAYVASYAPSYSVGYAASYAAPSTCSTCTAGYAPSCSTCTQQVTLRPVCNTCTTCSTCDSCSTCSTCSSGVVQTSYQQPSSCSTCNGGVQQQTVITEQRQPEPAAPQQTFSPESGSSSTNSAAAPSVDPNASVPIQREEQRPVTNGEEAAQPGPGGESGDYDPYETTNGDGSTYLQPPKLFDPNDRTAQRSIAPVTTALYQKQVSYRNVSTAPVTAAQVKQDAIGWSSASN